jgi:hypothetical protein
MSDRKEAGKELAALIGTAFNAADELALPKKFEKAVANLDDSSKSLNHDALMATYSNSPEDQKRLVRLNNKFESAAQSAGKAFLVGSVPAIWALYSAANTLDTHKFADAPFVSVPLAVLCGLAFWGSRKKAKGVVQEIKNDIKTVAEGNQLSYKKPAALPAPDTNKLI